MNKQKSKQLLALLESIGRVPLVKEQRIKALASLKRLPENASLENVIKQLKLASSLTLFALLLEQSLLS